MSLLKENLLVQFSVASFLILAVISVILANVISNKVRSTPLMTWSMRL